MAEGKVPSPIGLQVRFVRSGGDDVAILAFEWPNAELPSELTTAEREVAQRVLLGWSNARIAEDRGRSVRTVANQLASLFRKLGVGSRTELIARYGGAR